SLTAVVNLNPVFSVLNQIVVNQQGTFTQVGAGFNGTFSALAACCNGTFSVLNTITTNQQGTFSVLNTLSNAGTFSVLNTVLTNQAGTFSALAACCNGTFSVLNTVTTNQQGTFSAIAAGFNGTFSSLSTLNLQPVFTAIAGGFNGTFSSLAACCNGTFSTLNRILTDGQGSFTQVAAGFNGTFSALAACCNGTFSVLNTVIANQQTIITNQAGTFSALAACCNGTFSVLGAGFNGTFSVMATLNLQPVFTQVAAGFNGTFSALAACCNGTFSVLNRLDQYNCSPVYITQATFGPIGGVQTPLVINLPGIYRFASNVIYNPSGAGTQGIVINASDVTLDLSCYTFSQSGGGVVATDAIRVNSGFADVTIKNGKIDAFTRCGITVQSNTERISISDISITRCGIRGIELLGGAAGPKDSIHAAYIKNVNIIKCCTDSLAADRALYLQSTANTELTNININDCGALNVNAFSAVTLENCLEIECNDIDVDDGLALNDFRGFLLTNNSTRCTFNDCTTANNQAIGNARGFMLDAVGSSSSNTFNNCSSTSLTASALVDGFLTATNCNNNIFNNCQSNAHTSTGASTSALVTGFNCINNNGNTFINCLAQTNLAPASTVPFPNFGAIGFDFNTTQSCDAISCIATDNATGTNSNSCGFRVINGTRTVIKEGYSAGHNFGYRIDPINSTANAFTRNLAVKNVTQFSGFGMTSYQLAPSMAGINGMLTNPWTNAGIG
ncbi:MAG TPA: hypothetical protein VHO47_00460, partial [Candidatus Babeliales bacterium]|nr:hypothetical protein [Candidatus Babeliales bacterium]